MWRDTGFAAALMLSRIAFGYQFQSIATMGPDLTAAFGLDYAALGLLIGLYMSPGIPLALPGGFLGRRFGARPVVGAGLALMCVGSLLGAVLFVPLGLGIGRVIAGAGAIALVVMQGKMVADRFQGRSFMPVMSLLVASFPVGVGLAGLTHGAIVAAAGPAGLLLIGAALPAVALALFLPCADNEPTAGIRLVFPSRHESALVIVAGLMWTSYNAGYYGFLSYVPSLLAERGHPASTVAAVMTIATWTNLPATILGGWWAGRIGNRNVLVIGALAEVISVAGPAFADWPLTWAVLFGFGAALPAGVIIAMGTLSARPENRAVGMGLFYTTYYIGGTFLPALCGRAADLYGHPSAALVAAGFLSALAIPAYALHRRIERRG